MHPITGGHFLPAIETGAGVHLYILIFIERGMAEQLIVSIRKFSRQLP
jgi:hypothetical protein